MILISVFIKTLPHLEFLDEALRAWFLVFIISFNTQPNQRPLIITNKIIFSKLTARFTYLNGVWFSLLRPAQFRSSAPAISCHISPCNHVFFAQIVSHRCRCGRCTCHFSYAAATRIHYICHCRCRWRCGWQTFTSKRCSRSILTCWSGRSCSRHW